VLGEADIYISFGNFEKGEALLKSAINAEPNRSDYRLKLLELHKEAGNLTAFDSAYKALIDLDDDAAIAKAGALRAAIPDAASTPFAFGVTSAAAAEGISDEPEFDLDFDFDTADTQAPAPVQEEPVVLNEEDFDVSFDLDDTDVAELEPVVEAVVEPVVEPVAEAAAIVPEVAVDVAEDVATATDDGAFDLDFDLELDTPATEPKLEFDLTDVDLDAEEPASQLDAESSAMLGAVTADAGELDEDLGFLSDADEAATKLDLARAYIDMGDKDGARDILAEVLDEGRDEQKREAQALLDSIS